jgi:imidazolonepropionase-like amidohydrolase
MENSSLLMREGGAKPDRKVAILLFLLILVVVGFSIAGVILGVTAINNSKDNPSSACYYTNVQGAQKVNRVKTQRHSTFPFIDQGTIVILNGTLWTGVDPYMCWGCSIVVEDGIITQVGPDVQIPEGADVYEANGAFVTPGLVDMHSHVGVGAFPDDSFGTYDYNEATNPVTPQVRTIDAIDPNDPAIPLILSGGVTTSLILPGSANLIGGEATQVKMRGGSVANMTIDDAPRAFKMAVGENPKRVYGSRDQLPSTRMGNAWGFRRVFAEANDLYFQQQQWDCIDFQGVKQPSPRPYNAQLEPLVAILSGDALVNVHAYEVQDFEAVLRVAGEFGFTITAFHHALEAWKIPYIFAPDNITIATFADHFGFKMEAYDASVYAPSILVENGVMVAIKSDHDVIFAKHLINEAAKAHAYGLRLHEALSAVTIIPANAIGVGFRTGSLEVDKDGDIVIWDKHPLVVGARPTQVFIEGVLEVSNPLPPNTLPSVEPPNFNENLIDVSPDTITCVFGSAGQNISTYAIQGVTVWTMQTQTPITSATILVQNGIVTCIGTCTIPAGTYTFTLVGGVVIPGAISSYTDVGVSEVEQEGESQDGFVSGTDNSDIRAADGIRLNSILVWAAWAGGVTTQIARPQGSALISGTSAAFYTYGTIARDAVYDNEVALHITVGNAAKAGGYTSSVSGQFASLRSSFNAAKDDNTSTIYKVLNGSLPAVFYVNQADEIGSVLTFKQEYNLEKVIIVGGSEAAVIASDIAAAGVSVVLVPPLSFPAYFETRRSTDNDLGILLSAGVQTAIGEYDPDWVRNLRWSAGFLWNRLGATYNISQYTALSLFTSTVANIFELPLGVGTIVVGTPANFVMYDNNPLLTDSRVALNALGGYVQCYPQQQ